MCSTILIYFEFKVTNFVKMYERKPLLHMFWVNKGKLQVNLYLFGVIIQKQ